MEISDLICIGNLGFSHKNKKHYIKIKPDYLHLIPKLSNIFLIFKDHRVRYGKIDILKVVNDNTAVITINDEDLHEELKGVDAVKIALDEDDINQIDDESIYYDPVGMKVIWDGKEVGVIKDFFFNGAHYVYELDVARYVPTKMDLDVASRIPTKLDVANKPISVLIPDVDAFVIETNIEERYIRVVDLDQFIGL